MSSQHLDTEGQMLDDNNYDDAVHSCKVNITETNVTTSKDTAFVHDKEKMDQEAVVGIENSEN